MPVMDGPTMVRQVRAKYPDLPILFMSGYAEEQLRKSIDLDNVAFLAKPFSVQQSCSHGTIHVRSRSRVERVTDFL
jgi:two-component system cell cycle sensor histidine kinase/response regulator CckA